MPEARVMERLIRAHEFLSGQHVMSLALCADGQPHACSLMFAHTGFVLYWLSDPAARHSRMIGEGGGAASVTIAPDYADFRQIRGLQLHGSAHRVDRAVDKMKAMALLSGRYDFLGNVASAPVSVAAAMVKAAVYRFIPDRAVLIDNTEKFGAKDAFLADELAAFTGR